MPRGWDELPGRWRNIAPAPPAPVVSLGLSGSDADRCEVERPCDSCSRCEPLQFHRELLYQLAALPPPTKAACRTRAKTARRSRLLPVFISSHGLCSLAISAVLLRLLDRAAPDCGHQASSAAHLRPGQ